MCLASPSLPVPHDCILVEMEYGPCGEKNEDDKLRAVPYMLVVVVEGTGKALFFSGLEVCACV